MVGSIYKNRFNPNAIAIKYKGQEVTYDQLDVMVKKYANYFKKLGVKKGDRVILSCLNSSEFIYSYISIAKLGATIVPINFLLTFEEISYIIENSQAKLMIIHPAILLKAKLSKEDISKALKIEVVVLDEEFNNEMNSINVFEIEDGTDENSVSTFLYTSGTTGKPKAAMLTNKNLVSNTDQSMKELKIVPEDNFICVLPMFHVFAFTVCVLLPLYSGATITILESFQPKEVIDTLVNEGITIFAGVPTMYIVLLEAVKTNITFPKIRFAVSGGAALPVEIFRQAKERFSFPVIEGYGLTEASPVVSLNPVDGVQKEGSIGLPIHGVECKIVDENDNELPYGIEGELLVKGDNVMSGYFMLEEATKEALKGGWLHTGDIAKKDEEGYLYIVDRKKDLIIVGGLNVYPREIEEVIYKFPKVKEAAVVGIADKLRGEHAKAFVVLKEGETCDSKELLRFLTERLANYKLPRQIEFIESLPKNSTGKILKRLLKTQ